MKPRYCPPLNGLQARTLRDVQRDPWGYIERHRAPLPQRLAGWLGTAGVLALFGLLGALLAWGGRAWP